MQLWSTPIMIGEFNYEEYLTDLIVGIRTPRSYSEDNSVFEKSTDVIADKAPSFLDSPGLEDLKQIVIDNALDFMNRSLPLNNLSWKVRTMHSWSLNMTSESYLLHHNHKNSHLTAVYYFLVDTPEHLGKLRLTDPRTNANRAYSDLFNPWFDTLQFQPEAGKFLIFPSFVYHNVEVFKGVGRKGFACDFFFKG